MIMPWNSVSDTWVAGGSIAPNGFYLLAKNTTGTSGNNYPIGNLEIWYVYEFIPNTAS